MFYQIHVEEKKKLQTLTEVFFVCVCSRTVGDVTFLAQHPGECGEGKDQEREQDDQHLQLSQRRHRVPVRWPATQFAAGASRKKKGFLTVVLWNTHL